MDDDDDDDFETFLTATFEETVKNLADSIIAVRQGEQKFSEERKKLEVTLNKEKTVEVIMKVAETNDARFAALVDLLSALKVVYPNNPLLIKRLENHEH